MMNITSNSSPSQTDACVIHADFGTYIVYITVIISSVSICECLVVLLVTWLSVNLHTNTGILVASLAVNDILLAISFIANQISLVPFEKKPLWKSKLLISFVYGTSNGTSILSLVHMGVIAVDRYIQIAHPFYYMKAMTNRRTYVILLGLWVATFIFIIIPPTVLYDDQYHRRCMLLHQPIIFWSVGASMFLLSLILIFICYLKIAHVAFKHKQSAISRRSHFNMTATDVELSENVSAALRSFKFFALMFGVFFLGSFPEIFSTGLGFFYKIPENINVGMFSLMPIHTCINFLIYAFKTKEFHSSLVKILKGLKRRCCKDSRDI